MATRLVGFAQIATLQTNGLLKPYLIDEALRRTKKRQLINPTLSSDMRLVLNTLQVAKLSLESPTYGMTARSVIDRAKTIKVPKAISDLYQATKHGKTVKIGNNGTFVNYTATVADQQAFLGVNGLTAFDNAIISVYEAFASADCLNLLVELSTTDISIARDTHTINAGTYPNITINRAADTQEVTQTFARANNDIIANLGLNNLPPIAGGQATTTALQRSSSGVTNFTVTLDGTPTDFIYNDKTAADPLDKQPGPDLVSEAAGSFLFTNVNDANVILSSTYQHTVTAAEAQYFASMVMDKLAQMVSPPKRDELPPSKPKFKGKPQSQKATNTPNQTVAQPVPKQIPAPPGIYDGQTQTNAYISLVNEFNKLVDLFNEMLNNKTYLNSYI